METQYSRNIKSLFKNCKIVKSIKHIDLFGELHGEQREWWDRHHLFPRELSIYNHGTLVRSTKWYLNGQIESSITVIGCTKREVGFYSSGVQKYKKLYELRNKQWLRNGIWYGYYSNGFKHYAEKYTLNLVVSTIRFFSNGNVITKFSLEKSSSENSDTKDTEDTEDTEDTKDTEDTEDTEDTKDTKDTEESSIELTEKIFEESDRYRYHSTLNLPYKDI